MSILNGNVTPSAELFIKIQPNVVKSACNHDKVIQGMYILGWSKLFAYNTIIEDYLLPSI